MPTAENQFTEIGAFDAKTRLSELLRKVDQGERFTITVRGRAVAQLIPAKSEHDQVRVDEAVKSLLNFPRVEGISGETVLEWIREGRK
jgi:prevent-host-death family protein